MYRLGLGSRTPCGSRTQVFCSLHGLHIIYRSRVLLLEEKIPVLATVQILVLAPTLLVHLHPLVPIPVSVRVHILVRVRVIVILDDPILVPEVGQEIAIIVTLGIVITIVQTPEMVVVAMYSFVLFIIYSGTRINAVGPVCIVHV